MFPFLSNEWQDKETLLSCNNLSSVQALNGLPFQSRSHHLLHHQEEKIISRESKPHPLFIAPSVLYSCILNYSVTEWISSKRNVPGCGMKEKKPR